VITSGLSEMMYMSLAPSLPYKTRSSTKEVIIQARSEYNAALISLNTNPANIELKKYPDNPNWSFEKVHDYCYERGFTIYPGKISTTNTFRLCALGIIDVKDIEDFFIVFKEAMENYNIKVPVIYM